MKLPYNNKKGITLVEVIVGVFVLSIFAVGILSLLIYNNQAVSDSAIDKRNYSAASQKLDIILAAVSNSLAPATAEFDPNISYLKEGSDGSIEIDEIQFRTDFDLDDCTLLFEEDGDPLRGWYVTLTYLETVEIKGYASFAQGAFDK